VEFAARPLDLQAGSLEAGGLAAAGSGAMWEAAAATEAEELAVAATGTASAKC